MSLRLALLLLFTSMVGCMRSEQSAEAKRGRDHIQYYGCGSCHTIPDVPGAHATVGPPLDQMGERTYIAGILPNSPDDLSLWIQHPQLIHPGTAMPELGVTPQDAKESLPISKSCARQLGNVTYEATPRAIIWNWQTQNLSA